MKDMRIACIGAGNMGSAMVRGMLRANVVSPARITLSNHKKAKLKTLKKELGIRVTDDNAQAVQKADVVILAIKPQILPGVLSEIKDQACNGALFLSVAAGIPTSLIENLLGGKTRVIRAMPNIAAAVGEAATALCPGKFARKKDMRLARQLFETCGTVQEIKEELMDAVTGLSGTGPMYVFIIIEALSDAGVRMGLAREDATRLATQSVLGAARMVQETGQHPIYLKDLVTSPGGTAINALYSMEKTGLRAVLMEAVETATVRSRELGAVYRED